MKKTKLILIHLVIMGLFLGIANIEKVQAQTSVSFQFFYDELSPYGSWISYPQYGYAWVPSAGVGFRPYLSNGHWVFTEEGWMWVSYYNWGWAPFHYGSWVSDPELGWVWVPGYDWAPAWVTWGSYNGYYGWAPVQPGFRINISGYHPPIDYWCFMHPHHITASHYTDHFYVAHGRRINLGNNTPVINNVGNITVVNNLTKRNNAAFNAGPRRVDFENTAKMKLQPLSIRETAKPAKMSEEGNAVSIYRPKVAQKNLTTEKPRHVAAAGELKRNGTSKDNTVKREKIAPVSSHTESVERKEQTPKVNNSTPPSRHVKGSEQEIKSNKVERNKHQRVEPLGKPEQPVPHKKQNVSPEKPEQGNAIHRQDRKQPVKPATVPQQSQKHQKK